MSTNITTIPTGPLRDPVTGQIVEPSRDPLTGRPLQPAIDVVTGKDPLTGKPLETVLDPVTGKPIEFARDPFTGIHLEPVRDPATGKTLDPVKVPISGKLSEPAKKHKHQEFAKDPLTGKHLESVRDPVTGRPPEPVTGKHLELARDPVTGKPMDPVIVPLAGKHQEFEKEPLTGKHLERERDPVTGKHHKFERDPVTGKPLELKDPVTGTLIISGDQEEDRQIEAQEFLRRVKSLLTEGDAPSVEILSDALEKLEQLSLECSSQTNDSQTRKTLQDIYAMLVSARQMGRNKNISERMQRIADETQLALEASQRPGVSESASMATQKMVDFTATWRPLFYLLISTRDFRELIVDSIRISKHILGRYTDDPLLSDHTEQKFLEGQHPVDIATHVKDTIMVKGAPEIRDDEWDSLQDDIQRVLAILAKEPQYRDGIETIFKILDMFQEQVAIQPVPTETKDVHFQRVVNETEDLVATFSGREILEDFKYHLRRIIIEVRENTELKVYLSELRSFILNARSEEEIRSIQYRERSKVLAYRGRILFQQLKEDADIDAFFDAANIMIENIKNDEFLQILRHHAGIIQDDLSYTDSTGKTQVDTDIIMKLQEVLVPVLADALKYIPLPRIESSNKKIDFWLDNIVLCSYDVLPENICFHIESDSEISLRDIESRGTQTNLVVKLNNIRTELLNLQFWIKKKSHPTLEDSGTVTFRIKGDGAFLALTYRLIQDRNETTPRISAGYATFDITKMDIEFDTSTIKHKILLPMLTRMFKSQIKKQIERQVEKNLNQFMAKLGDLMTNALGQMNRPFFTGLDVARKAVKSSQLGQVYERRREKLE